MTAYNIEAAKVDISVFRNDSIKMSFEVKMNGAPYPSLSSAQIDICIRNVSGELVKSFSSAGVSPKISIDDITSTFSINSIDGVTENGTFLYDVQLKNGSEISTIMWGKWVSEIDQTDI